MEDGQTSSHERRTPFDHLVVKTQKLVKECDKLISQIQAQPGFDSFLIPPLFDKLCSAAANGPVILINHSKWHSDIIILLHDSIPSLISINHDFYDHTKGLHDSYWLHKIMASTEVNMIMLCMTYSSNFMILLAIQ